MKAVKRVAAWLLALAVLLIPTYILVYHIVQTAAPKVTVGDVTLEPVFVQWRVTRKNEESSLTAQDQERARKSFERSEPQVLPSLDSLEGLTFSRQPDRAVVSLFDLSGSGASYPSFNWDEIGQRKPELVGKTQIVLAIQWTVGKNIRIQAMYSIEVNV